MRYATHCTSDLRGKETVPMPDTSDGRTYCQMKKLKSVQAARTSVRFSLFTEAIALATPENPGENYPIVFTIYLINKIMPNGSFILGGNLLRHRKTFFRGESLFGGWISSSAFLSRRPFGYYLPIASYGTIFAAKWSSNGGLEAVVSEWLAQGHKGLTAHLCSFYFAFLRQMRYFLSLTIPLS